MALQDVLESFRDEVTAFAATGVVHRDEGTTIASVADEGFDAAAGNAYLAEILKLHNAAQAELDLSGDTEDVVVQTPQGTLYARPVPDTEWVWTVMAGSEANVPLTRAVMRRYHDKIVTELP